MIVSNRTMEFAERVNEERPWMRWCIMNLIYMKCTYNPSSLS